MAVEDPLRRIIAVRPGQAVRVSAGRYRLPTGKVERHFHERRIRDSEFLVNTADFLLVFGGCAKSPQSW
jgi:hypothetical protein